MGFMDKFKDELKKQFVTKPAEQKQQEEADKAKAEAKQFKSGDVYNNRILDDKNATALNNGYTLTNAQLETLPKSKADTADTILASNNEQKAEKQKEATNQKIVETTDRQRVYDNTDGNAKQKQEASDKAKDVSTPDKAYDTYATWNEYYDALKKSGKSDDEIMALLKGSRWEKEGSKYDQWKKSKTKPAEAEQTEAEPKAEEKPTENPAETPQPTEEANPTENVSEVDSKFQLGSKIDPSSLEGQVLNGKKTYPEYLNTAYPSIAGAIFSKDSGLTVGERIRMGVSVIGKLVGNAMLANGMSLLGDNSFFSKIGDGVSLDNYTTEQQKKLADAIAEQQSDMLKDVTANSKVVDDLLSGKIPDEKKQSIIKGYAHVLAQMPDDELNSFLSSNGFTPAEAEAITQTKPFFKFSSKRATDKINEITASKTAETNQQKNEYLFGKDVATEKAELSQRITELEKQKADIISSNTFDRKLELMAKAGDIMGAIGNASKSSGSSSSKSLNGNLGAKIKIIDAGISGAISSGSSEGINESFNEYRKKAIDKYENDYNEWMEGEGGKLQMN